MRLGAGPDGKALTLTAVASRESHEFVASNCMSLAATARHALSLRLTQYGVLKVCHVFHTSHDIRRLLLHCVEGPLLDNPGRNAGILGVPNASGPMADAEGRKRYRGNSEWVRQV